ncbi:MAG: tyrosine-type recombinase/integrase, partial [Clostridia bacterium]|nr:tyrosine-type recombinase/integrase [Clostridia bacterium]
MNFRLWIEQYFTVYRALELKPSTLSSYLKNLVYIPFDWEYETVTLFDVQSLINKLVANGLSSSTVKHVVQVIREPLDNGFRFGLPDRHGTLYALSLPKMRKKLVHALSDAELTKLKPYLNESEYSDVYLALLHTGMRCCELTGLNCGDFDFQSSSLKIHRSFYRGKLSEATKSDSGIRVIPLNLPSKLIFIRNMCVFTPNKPLFRNLSGSRLSYNTLVHNWHKILDLADVERCGLHVLR